MIAVRCGIAAALAALLGACSIDPRSTAFACSGPADCSDGRTCERGWCVHLAGAGDAAAPLDAGDQTDAAEPADATPAVCSEEICDLCDDGTCVMLCTQANSCPDGVVCPPGLPCRVRCDGASSCAGGVDCSLATSCEIECDRGEACAGPVTCGAGPCDVECTARDTCLSGIDCSDSCACTTRCAGPGSCPDLTQCPDADCVTSDGECTSDAGCDFCR